MREVIFIHSCIFAGSKPLIAKIDTDQNENSPVFHKFFAATSAMRGAGNDKLGVMAWSP